MQHGERKEGIQLVNELGGLVGQHGIAEQSVPTISKGDAHRKSHKNVANEGDELRSPDP
jgi:hypothetical protein